MVPSDQTKKLQRFGLALHGVGGLVLLVAGVGFYLAVLQPTAEARDDCRQAVADEEQCLARAPAIRGEHDRKKADLAIARQRASDLAARIPEQANESRFLALVTEAADRELLVLRDYRPGATTPGGTYSEMAIELSGEGSYASICGFLDQLQQLPRLCRISELTIDARQTTDGYPFDLTMVLYFGLRTDTSDLASGQEHE